MNKYNIESGDTVRNKYDVFNYLAREVSSTLGVKLDSNNEWTSWDDLNKDNYHVTVKGTPKGKIIGYELLKDTPEFKKGVILKYVAKDNEYSENGEEDADTVYYPKTVETQPEWFKPIYEPIKPTEVKVQTLAGEVKVTNKHISLPGERAITHSQFDTIKRSLAKANLIDNSLSDYNVVIETFKVGCKTFHVSDIAKIEEAIKQVS